MAGEPEGQGLPRRAHEEALDPIRTDDHLTDARVISETQVCQRGRRGSLGYRMERWRPGPGEPMDGSLRRGQRRIDKRDGVPSARSPRAGLRRARWTGQWSDGEPWSDG